MQSVQDISTDSRERSWFYWFLLPIYPYRQRRTLRTEVVKDAVWTFDQLQGIFYVVTPIRMTVIKLDEGGLLIYAPVALTRECSRLLDELVALHGEVKYIVLPTISGLEHKVCVPPFARRFPKAQIYVPPSQWSYPANLPLTWLGFPKQRTHVLDGQNVSFSNQFESATLGPIGLGLGPFGEIALLDKSSRTLLVTDSVVSVPEVAPEIIQLDPYPLLFHARETAVDRIEDTEANRLKGWQRVALFTFYFRPSALDIADLAPSVREAMKAPDRSKKALFGWYPFHWKAGWQRSFEALRKHRLVVAPILQQLILNREPQKVMDWANQVASWNFERIIPCHFDAPIPADAQEFRSAFSFLEKESDRVLPDEDFELLREIEQGLVQTGVTPPAQEKL
ncbi:DUF4336 domain-containing protein [Leptolyngbya sp. GGD]|uniref:DUF4336 domain-containing protein n=1 Tax=Leptolyngbya sp. GGD TaxID=2997907 RepID=UPI00227D4CF2|nr:DUF4336 domain-containing protein [Leptolyngbya sp. GGD]MCY6491736.1 DUF4336 domain-containing protein [Leptolyngbya sp. GGD]